DLSLGAGGSGSATFGDGVSVVGSSVLIEGGDGLIGAAAEVDVTGSENVRVASIGSVVELSGSGELEYSMFVWRSSEAFDEYTNSVPLVSDVEEVIIRASVPGSIRAVSPGGMRVHMDLQGPGSADDWNQVWGSQLGAGSYSLDGLHVRFERQDVVGVRLGSYPPSNPSFEGWSTAVFHFGRVVNAGTVSVSATSMLELTSGEAMSVSSDTVRVSAGSSVEIGSGDTIQVMGDVVSVESVELLEAESERVSVSAGAMDVFSGGLASVSAGSVAVEAYDSMAVSSGETLSVLAQSGQVDIADVLAVTGNEVNVRAGSRISAYSGDSVSLATDAAEVNAGVSVRAFAGESASFVTGRAYVEATESLSLHTRDIDLVTTGAVSVESAEDV
ncbi:MAG: hypothetical protein VXX04_00690, partial [Actinomycetota bacterium]|nr:hypothetical protein [Actinomycetota bacterium]